ncbi:PAS domain-containing sensor histidine kinase [Sideroxydans lithotrophicus]|uniref:Oxygen sensor histidine kinase NreB n=1 Tax=Sideroxydans lithotrophicus (strain ES-1) TaxID=580332 RepID=D5CSW3_SIDLE|nr:PAS domain S-box protein [Sideroxydans lithotrophicus]ADE12049.1 PAS/PAC sensor signal transduction histidine kinase [Sideroxydans lithotrophicus ES-1]
MSHDTSHSTINVDAPQDNFPPPNCPFDDCRANRLGQTQQARLEWEFTADSIPQLIFLLDRDEHILRTNRTLEHWGLGQVVNAPGRKIHDLLHPDCKDTDCHLKHIWRYSAGNRAQNFAVEYQTEDKFLHRHLNLHFRFHHLPQDAEAGLIVAVISDISDVKLAETKLKNSKDELERRIEENTFALISTNIRLQQEIENHKRIEEKLEKNRAEYSQLVEAMEEGLVILDKQGAITYANRQFCNTLGYSLEEMIGHTLMNYVAAENRPALERHMAERAQGSVATYVANLAGVDGQKFWVKISPTLLNDQKGETTGSFAIIADEVNHLNVQQVLRETSIGIEDLYDNAPCGHYMLDNKDFFVTINTTKTKWLGYTKDEMIGKLRFQDLLTEASARQYASYYPRLKNVGHVRDLELELVRKDGSILPVLLSATAIRNADGQFMMSQAIVCDISYRSNAEQSLRESEHAKRMLTAQVLSAQEKERKRIANELHDGIGQTLSAIKFYVENAISKLNERTIDDSIRIFGNVIPKLQGAIEEMRRISMDLRPSMLDDIGTLATLSWFCRQFQGVYESFRIELLLDIKESDIQLPLRTAIFRIVQETMNNCAKYSQANCIHISLIKTCKEIELTVEDDGRGFDHAEVCARIANAGGGMGLVSMRERAELSGGTFSVESAKCRGTSVRVTWPFQESSPSPSTTA